ncbi:MAG: PAS domain-containing sensor histidine kinase [Verrucomicrobia bacterium]|nr:PAS domain-containing sensor histidine kinase [Verrucomicrobiota bacterium]
MRKPRLTHDRAIWLLTTLSGLPAVGLAAALLWGTSWPPLARGLAGGGVVAIWIGVAFAVRARVVRPLQTLANLLGALREGDFSIEGRGARSGDPLGEVMLELNGLTEMLREQRLGALEATALLRTVMEEINVAVFTFDDQQRLRLTNRAGERLLAQPMERLLGRSAEELGLAECLAGEPARTISMTFPGGLGRWGTRRSRFRQGGAPHQLLVLTDLSQALREEERLAWQRLLRVLGHELNNSLAPIKSITGSLLSLIGKERLPDDWKEDAQQGLTVIAGRAEALSRFMEAYSRLARLPPPKRQPVAIGPLLERVVGLERRLPVQVRPGPELEIQADSDQLEQVLINLLRNAVDAACLANGGASVGWTKGAAHLEIRIEDEGPGISNEANLFVPFFTTKPGGSGIGLVLSRQIAEAHGGSLTLENRVDRTGSVARLRLPLR